MKVYGTLMLHALRSNYQKCVWKIYFGPKKDTNSQEGHGWMIEDGQLLFDRMSDPRVVMEMLCVNVIECAKALNASGFQMHSCKNQ